MARTVLWRVSLAFMLVALMWAVAAAQDGLLSVEDIVGSGGRSSGGEYVLTDFIGYPVGGESTGGGFVVWSGGLSGGGVSAPEPPTNLEPKIFLPAVTN